MQKRTLGIRALKHDALSSQPVNGWCMCECAPISAKAICPEMVSSDPDNMLWGLVSGWLIGSRSGVISTRHNSPHVMGMASVRLNHNIFFLVFIV